MTDNKFTSGDIEKYVIYLKSEERSPATIEKYVRDITAFYHFLPKDKLVMKENVIAYKDYLLDHYEITSTNSMLAAVNGFLQFKEWGDCKVKRVKVQRKVYCDESRELTKEEYYRLLKASDTGGQQRLNLILQTLCGTGIRISELKYFTVKAVKTGRVVVNCKDKVRTVFIPMLLRNKLLVYISKKGITDGSVFLTKGGKLVDRSNIWSEMQKLCKRAEVLSSKVFPHNLRHLFARTYYQLKHDLTKLADILGHSNIETTRIYTISTGKEHEQQMECLGLVT